MVKLVGTGNPRAKYRTRRLLAGDEVDLPSRDARLYKALGWAEDAPVKRRGRPPKAQPEPEPEPEPEAAAEAVGDGLEGLSNAALRAMAEDRGIDLPAGYLRNDELIEMLRGGE